jgi:hyperosmotically inducible periplasmic protein
MLHHRVRRTVHAIVFTGLSVAMAGLTMAQAPADNTKVNKRDQDKGAVTADQQKENSSDREITQKIRRSLMQDKTLSSYAHNVKVVAQDGRVTLKGPVRSEDEKRAVEAKAIEVVGAEHVTNEMSVAPTSKSAKPANPDRR